MNSDTFMIILIIALAILFIILVTRLIANVIIGFSNMRLKLHENEMAKQNLEIETQKKLQSMAYITPDARGALPIPRHVLEDGGMQDWLRASYESLFAPKGEKGQSLAIHQPTIADHADFFTLWQNDKLPKDGKILIGYNASNGDAVEASFHDLASTLIGGQSGGGKSTFLRLVLTQALMQGFRMAIIDPHANAGEESLAGSFVMLEKQMFRPIAREVIDQLNTIAAIKKEIEDRINGIKSNQESIILVIDEIGSVLNDVNTSGPVSELLKIIANQSRKAHVYALAIGQDFHSKTIATTIRNGFISVISTWSKKDVAGLLSDSSDFRTLVSELEIGQIVWQKRRDIMVLKVPNVTARHVALIMGSGGYRTIEAEYQTIPRKEEVKYPLPKQEWIDEKDSGQVVENSGQLTLDSSGLDPEKMIEIKKRAGNLESPTKIICDLWKIEGKGNDFQLASKEYRKYIAALIRQGK